MATQEYYKSEQYQKPYMKKYYENPENRLKSVWRTMLYRCENPKSDMFYAYGGRGIRVCDDWHDFDKFKADMLEGYKKGLSIDRIDNNTGYCKTNCKWSTPVEQAQNTRRTRKITYCGKTATIPQWARELGINRSTLSMRFYTYKWSIKDCLTKNI